MFHFEPCFKVPWPVTSPSLIVDLGLIQQGCWFKLKTCLFKYRAYVNKDLTACLLNQRNIGYSWLHKRKVQRQTAISKQGSLGSRLLQYIHLVQGASSGLGLIDWFIFVRVITFLNICRSRITTILRSPFVQQQQQQPYDQRADNHQRSNYFRGLR